MKHNTLKQVAKSITKGTFSNLKCLYLTCIQEFSNKKQTQSRKKEINSSSLSSKLRLSKVQGLCKQKLHFHFPAAQT